MTKAWYAIEDGKRTRVVDEQPNGNYSISDWHNLTVEQLRRVHAVIGEVLTDLATPDVEAPSAEMAAQDL